MRELETDYLVVGAGASGVAFADALVHASDADVVLVDRRHAPGGHWLDAYPFVRLHQPSAYYGVDSRPLGADRIDTDGPNAGFYERATGAEICDYYARVVADLEATGRVRFLPLADYRGERDGRHAVVSLLAGTQAAVRVRRKVVDATYVRSEVPSRRAPGFEVEEGARLVPPNGLVDLAEPAGRFTVIGGGKTAMDTCTWLLEHGVDPDNIRWLRPRDAWFFDRAFTQPLDHVATYMQLQACWVEAAAAAEDGPSFARRLEEAGMFVRVDPAVEPLAFRGATVSRGELEGLRTIRDVVRGRRVVGVGRSGLVTDAGDLPGEPREVYVDCTAPGVRRTDPRPVFEPGRVTIQYVAVGFLPWSAATIGRVEALDTEDVERNRLCPPAVFTGDVDDILRLAYPAMAGQTARMQEPVLAAWTASTRLNPAQAARASDPEVAAALRSLSENVGPALRNLAQRTATAV